jgi:hypothetical protein
VRGAGCRLPLGGRIGGIRPEEVGLGTSDTPSGAARKPLLLAFLVLTGANRRAAAGPNEEDRILTAEEVASLNLEGVEWAVLSACNTGLGEIKAGGGVMSLRRAFQIAGARTVIMSLWPVDDQATRSWMAFITSTASNQSRREFLRTTGNESLREMNSSMQVWLTTQFKELTGIACSPTSALEA